MFVFDARTTSSTHDLLNCRCCCDDDGEDDENDNVENNRDEDEDGVDASMVAIEDDRKSRIFKTESSAKKFQGISELMDWRHVATPFDEDFDDDLLIRSQDDISMIFRNITQNA